MAYITIDKSALLHNLTTIIQQARSIEKVALVLKDNAYGHGLVEIATIVADEGIRRSIVRTMDEARKIYHFFDHIIVLADCDQASKDNKISFVVNNLHDLEKLPHGTQIELKIDTGMHRNGIVPDQLKEAFTFITQKKLKLVGVMTHMRSADELSSELFWQQQQFTLIKDEVNVLLDEYNLPSVKFHSANSATLFRLNRIEDDFVRVGIALYGGLEMAKGLDTPLLKPVLALRAKRLSSRKLLAGERVGYSGTYTADQDETVSNFDLGYADGFPRLQLPYTTPQGFRLLGRVSMDNLSLACDEEDVIIFDDARKMAKIQQTISYEVTTRLSTQIKRTIIEGNN
jgi:alanine racemase